MAEPEINIAFEPGLRGTVPKSRAVEVPEILLEVRSAATSGDLGPRVVMPEEFKLRAKEIADSIGKVAEDFRSRLGHVLDNDKAPGWRVGSIEIEFNIAVQAETGVVIAKTSAGATFTARLIMEAPRETPS